jgi:hypothetical protein
MGYAHAKKYLEDIPLGGETMDASATKNREPNLLYSFRSVFSGKSKSLTFPGILQYSLFFRFAEFDSKNELEVYSSLKISESPYALLCFDHHSKITNSNTGRLLEIESQIMINDQIHKILVSTILTTPIEMLLGLNFKRMKFLMWDQSGKLILETILFQPIIERFKGIYFSSLKTATQKGAGIKKRFSTINKFISYGI